VGLGRVVLDHLLDYGLAVETVETGKPSGLPLVIGGGEVLAPLDNPYHRLFRRKGRHVLCSVGVFAGAEDLGYLNEYEFVSVRTGRDRELVREAGGPDAPVFACPGNLVRPEPSHIDASGRIGVAFSHLKDYAWLEALDGPVLAFPWRRDMAGLAHRDDIETATRIARTTGGDLLRPGLTPGQLLEVIGQLDMFIGQTLHGAIWAYQAGVPFLVHGYAPKVRYWAGERDLMDRVFDDPGEVPSLVACLEKPDPRGAARDRQSAEEGLKEVCEAAARIAATEADVEEHGEGSMEAPRPLASYGQYFMERELEEATAEMDRLAGYVRRLEREIAMKDAENQKAGDYARKLEEEIRGMRSQLDSLTRVSRRRRTWPRA
jgi:hypothetical protein